MGDLGRIEDRDHVAAGDEVVCALSCIHLTVHVVRISTRCNDIDSLERVRLTIPPIRQVRIEIHDTEPFIDIAINVAR